MIDFVFRRGRQSDQQGVEVSEDRTVFLVHRTMCLIDNDQVKVTGSEAPQGVLPRIDQAHHRLIGTQVDATLGGPICDEVDRCGIR